MKSLENVLGNEGVKYFRIIENILPHFSGRKYYFENADELLALYKQDPVEANFRYWRELIGRFHFASASSIMRSYRWAKGIVKSYDDKNYLSFAANYRGFIESASDSFDVLMKSAKTFAEVQKNIKYTLQKKSPIILLTAQDVEDLLIHYSHGRKVKKDDVVPASHKAKSVREYLDILKYGADEAIDLYAFLCQVAHPSAHSTSFFLNQIDKRGNEYELGNNNDVASMDLLTNEYKNTKNTLMMYAFNPSFLSLKLINLLEINDYYTKPIDNINFEGIPAWSEIKKTYNSSKLYRA